LLALIWRLWRFVVDDGQPLIDDPSASTIA
jgi:hypothetical protein